MDDPSCMISLQSVWVDYKLACDEIGLRAVAYNTFCTLWRQLVPHITVTKPKTDLCWSCSQNSAAIMRAANTPAENKSEVNHNTTYIRCATYKLKSSTRL